MSETNMETRFTAAMLDIYNTALSELKYPATRFRQMVIEQGGVAAAKRLLATADISDGFAELWARKRLDLTMEALILREPWRDLFTADELATADTRLQSAGYSEVTHRED